MIDNVILLLKGTLNGRDVNELIGQVRAELGVLLLVAVLGTEYGCVRFGQLHPLGKFDESIMRSICTFEPNAKGYSDLYETVLIDTPIGTAQMDQFLEESAGGDRMEGTSDVRNVLEEVQMELIKNSMLKLWLEDFYNFCQVRLYLFSLSATRTRNLMAMLPLQEIGGETAAIMGDILAARADRIAINITLNSFGTPLNEVRVSRRVLQNTRIKA
ncbi:unnamed protein product [Phytophthora fragariaefolia]|uniref:Unnamed protein product n=1 Tax=Phytophthora fragariaefolia TaxID=1490495 RepID=A0A9W7CUU1_9STRA|nr:unnamed protein product [Phytophthora fragariaefolia]